MKKLFNITRPSFKIGLTFFFVGAMICSMLSSCSGDKGDVSELLKTVPADASAVVAVNVKTLVEKTGSKIDGSKIVAGKELQALINKENKNDSEVIAKLLNGEAGIDPTSALAFLEGNDFYITGFLADPDKFKDFNQKEYKGTFSESNGVFTLENVAYKGNQFWIHASHRNSIDPAQIVRFLALDEKLSFLSNGYAESLADFSHDVEGWGNLSALYNTSGMSFQQKTMAGMGLAFLFSDAQDISFYADFSDGKMESSLTVLDSKGKPAKFNLPAERIDLGMVKDFTPSGDLIIAMAVSPKLVEQLQKDFGDKNIPGLGELMPALSALDGTFVIEGNEKNFKGKISTKGDGVAALSDFISNSFNVTVKRDGKFLTFENGPVAGGLKNEEIAPLLKGATFAVAASAEQMKGKGYDNVPLKNTILLLAPQEGSMKLEVIVNSSNPKENFLLTFIKAQL